MPEQPYQRMINPSADLPIGEVRRARHRRDESGGHRETATKYLEAGEGPPPEKKQGRRRLDPLATIGPGADAADSHTRGRATVIS